MVTTIIFFIWIVCMIIILKIDEENEGIVKEKVNTNSKSVFKRARLAGQTGTDVSTVPVHICIYICNTDCQQYHPYLYLYSYLYLFSYLCSYFHFDQIGTIVLEIHIQYSI